jgi:RHS repeat-associated protein
VNGSGSLTSWHFHLLAGEQVIGRQLNTGNRRYYHTDLLGSTRAVVEGATIVESYDFEPWGLLMPGRTLGSGTKEGFTTKERDAESGLDYFGARYYMAAFGRWSSPDPLVDKYIAWSPYNYTLNNPIASVDPLGLETIVYEGRAAQQFFRELKEQNFFRDTGIPDDILTDKQQVSRTPNLSTGDAILDNASIRRSMDAVWNAAPRDAQGYKLEMGGSCRLADGACAIIQGQSRDHTDIPLLPNADMVFHTHPNEGRPVPRQPGNMYTHGPSIPDLVLQQSRARQGNPLPTHYIVGEHLIYRFQWDAANSRFVHRAFPRWRLPELKMIS